MESSRHFYFRGVVTLPDNEIAQATLKVCADTRYRLWLNGQMLGHGPARSEPAYQYYDLYELPTQLKAGENLFAAFVTHYGVGTCYSRLGSPGFLLEVEITFTDGSTQVFGTGEEWCVAVAPYRTGFPQMSIQLAYPEVFDAREEPVGWNLKGFDDSKWERVRVIGKVGCAPWLRLMPRDIPLPFYRAIAPVRVVHTHLLHKPLPPEGEQPLPTPAEDMERATQLRPAPSQSVQWRHPALLTIAPQQGETGVAVVLDFGKEVSGFPILVVRKASGGQIDIGYSERIEADGTMNPNRWGGCDVHYADRFYLRAGFQRFDPLDHRSLRYLRLDFYDNPEPIEILVEMQTSGYPVQYRGDFQCSDALLQRIWEVGRYTTELCMDDAFMDTPWRERGQWLGDMRVEMLVAAYTFGDSALARKAFLQYIQSQDDSGWFRGVFPSDPPFDPVLPTFCCLLPVAVWEYFLLTEDKTLLTELWEGIQKLARTLLSLRDEEGLLCDLPGWVFVDWANVITKGQSASVNALAYWALEYCARIARALGYPEQGGQWEMGASEIKEGINDLLWNPIKGFYADSRIEGHPTEATSQQSNVLCALVGITDARQRAQIFDFLSTPGRSKEVEIATPYFAYYLLELLFANGQYDWAMDTILARWKPMLDAGATTFWEQWEPHWSLCHAWSAAPTYLLMAQIAGIRPLQPAFEEFSVEPHPGHLTWFRTVVPTVRGDIELGWHTRTDIPKRDPMGSAIPMGATSPAITVNLTVPNGTRAHVRLPLQGIQNPTVRLNNRTVWEAGKPLGSMGGRFTREADTLTFAIISGRYHIEIDR